MENTQKEIPSSQSQYNKIVNAYMKDELDPMISCACFIGNLLNGSSEWNAPGKCKSLKSTLDEVYGFYKGKEIYEMESNFLSICSEHLKPNEVIPYKDNVTEEGLYKAMESTLLMLKAIHEAKGEIVENYSFKKRELCY